MAKKKTDSKTNAMRELEEASIPYKPYEYDTGGTVPSGIEAASIMGLPVVEVYKTLVTKGRSGECFVFCIPAAEELDLKKAAQTVGEKNVEMIPQKDLLPYTGSVHVGCSSLAMKKRFKTVLEEEAEILDTFLVSGGRVGLSLQLSPSALAEHIGDSLDCLVGISNDPERHL